MRGRVPPFVLVQLLNQFYEVSQDLYSGSVVLCTSNHLVFLLSTCHVFDQILRALGGLFPLCYILLHKADESLLGIVHSQVLFFFRPLPLQ